uniref:AlNc14C283G10135 protein n=1 Tax=Albugo laibachii Nc14 TaxID=890382 RepID=F0WUY8_9STRA|nr:AlNc14C283G10135 [Albugo laibachii Nc14]|eukprot:CCA25224.1 AlNc14C283G10135 [Albugo laibachii Nc14]
MEASQQGDQARKSKKRRRKNKQNKPIIQPEGEKVEEGVGHAKEPEGGKAEEGVGHAKAPEGNDAGRMNLLRQEETAKTVEAPENVEVVETHEALKDGDILDQASQPKGRRRRRRRKRKQNNPITQPEREEAEERIEHIDALQGNDSGSDNSLLEVETAKSVKVPGYEVGKFIPMNSREELGSRNVIITSRTKNGPY